MVSLTRLLWEFKYTLVVAGGRSQCWEMPEAFGDTADEPPARFRSAVIFWVDDTPFFMAMHPKRDKDKCHHSAILVALELWLKAARGFDTARVRLRGGRVGLLCPAVLGDCQGVGLFARRLARTLCVCVSIAATPLLAPITVGPPRPPARPTDAPLRGSVTCCASAGASGMLGAGARRHLPRRATSVGACDAFVASVYLCLQDGAAVKAAGLGPAAVKFGLQPLPALRWAYRRPTWLGGLAPMTYESADALTTKAVGVAISHASGGLGRADQLINWAVQDVDMSDAGAIVGWLPGSPGAPVFRPAARAVQPANGWS